MQVLGILFPLIGLVALVAWVWLVVVAFKHSVGWGVGVLLLSPISAVVFAVKYWQESRKPFLIYVGSVTASLAMVMAMFTFLGSAVMSAANQMSEGEVGNTEVASFMEESLDRIEEAGEFTPEQQEELQEMRQTIPVEDGGTVDAPMAGDEPSATSSRPERSPIRRVVETPVPEPVESASVRRQHDIVFMRDVAKHVGKILFVVAGDGRTFQGRLVSDDGEDLVFEKSYASGTMAVSWSKSEIESLHKVRARTGP